MNTNIRKLTYTAVAAAIIFVITWTVKLPIPATSIGYIHPGDAMIFLSAFLLGGPLGAAAAAVGSAIADAAAGYAIYIPATFIIKGLMGLLVGFMARKKSFGLFVFACIIGGAVMTAGYFVFEVVLYGIPVAVPNLPFNLAQAGGGVAIALVLFPAIKRIDAAAHFDELRR